MRRRLYAGLALAAMLLPGAGLSALPQGQHGLHLQRADGSTVQIGSVTFDALDDGQRRFHVSIDHTQFRDHFLSMKEFKCLDGAGEIHCHVGYPYAMPDVISEGDLSWLEHALLFFYKRPDEFGARLRNGVYYKLELVDGQLRGTPEAIDLDLISAPPDDPEAPPYTGAERVPIDPAERAFKALLID